MSNQHRKQVVCRTAVPEPTPCKLAERLRGEAPSYRCGYNGDDTSNARARADRAYRVVEAGKKARAMARGAERVRRYLRRQARAVRRTARREEMSAWLLSTIQLRHEVHKRKRSEAELLASSGAQWKRLRRTQRQD